MGRITKLQSWTLLLTVTLWPLPAAAQSLAWKFAPGDNFEITLDQETRVDTVVDRREVNRSNQTTLTISWQVQSLQEDQAVIRQTIDRVVTELTMPGEKGALTVRYDSKEDKPRSEAKRMADSFSRIIGQPVFITISPRGEIADVEIPPETLESLRQMPGSIQGRKMFEAESIREMFAQSGLQLPESATAESWESTRNFSIGTPQVFQLTTKYTLQDATANPLQIDFTGDLKLIEDSEERPAELEFENLSLAGQQASGSILFDTQTGNCVSSQSTTMLKTRTRYRDMEVMATVNSQITMSVLRK